MVLKDAKMFGPTTASSVKLAWMQSGNNKSTQFSFKRAEQSIREQYSIIR